MIIKPPSDYGLPEPKLFEEPKLVDWGANRKIELYWDVEPWKCPECGCKVFGRCKACVYCKFKLNKHTPRPSNFVITKRS